MRMNTRRKNTHACIRLHSIKCRKCANNALVMRKQCVGKYTGVTLYRPFKNAKCRKCTRALEAANVAQLVQEAQSGRRSIHLQLANGP